MPLLLLLQTGMMGNGGFVWASQEASNTPSNDLCTWMLAQTSLWGGLYLQASTVESRGCSVSRGRVTPRGALPSWKLCPCPSALDFCSVAAHFLFLTPLSIFVHLVSFFVAVFSSDLRIWSLAIPDGPSSSLYPLPSGAVVRLVAVLSYEGRQQMYFSSSGSGFLTGHQY